MLTFETCTVTRWRGYVTSTFVALLADGTPVAESASFRARGAADPPDEGGARSALDGLCSTLEGLGWNAVDDPADTWYAVRFSRQSEAVAETPVEAAPPPAPAPRQLAPPQLVAPRPAPPRPVAPPPAPPAPPVVTAPGAPPAPPIVSAPAAAPAPPIVSAPAARHGRPSRRIVVVSTLGIAAAVALGGYLVLRPSGGQASPPAAAAATHTPKVHVTKPAAPVQRPAPVQKAAPVRKAALVRVDITAPERASWLEIRRGSATGPVLFSGELAPGRHLHLTGKRLWARFGAASNLSIRANGRPISFIGTYEHVFTAKTK